MRSAANVGNPDHRFFGHLYSPVSRMCARPRGRRAQAVPVELAGLRFDGCRLGGEIVDRRAHGFRIGAKRIGCRGDGGGKGRHEMSIRLVECERLFWNPEFPPERLNRTGGVHKAHERIIPRISSGMIGHIIAPANLRF